MKIQEVRPNQVSKIAKLYYETVRQINSRDYSSEQINAWAPRIEEESYWLSRWDNCLVLVAQESEQILGFVEFRPHGEVDCFYVSHLAQRMGVGKAMIARVILEAQNLKLKEIWADVSVSAKPFFESMGFKVEREQIRSYRSQEFQQYFMKRLID